MFEIVMLGVTCGLILVMFGIAYFLDRKGF